MYSEVNGEVGTARTGRRGPGRAKKEKDVKPAVVKLEELSTGVMRNLTSLARAHGSAATEFSESVKAVAKKSGLRVPVLRAFVLARSGDKFADRKESAEQLSLLFETVGE